MKKLLIIAVLFSSATLYAQNSSVPSDTSYWRIGGVSSLNFSQVSLNNWAAGGNNSLSLGGYFNLFLTHEKGANLWQTNIETGYGVVKQGFNVEPTKTDDFIIINSQYSHKMKNGKWSFTGMLDFRTQYYDGVNEDGIKISDWFAPAYILASIGVTRQFGDNFSLFLAPATGKFTIVNDPLLAAKGSFGVKEGVIDTVTNEIIEDGESFRSEIGFLFRALYANDEIIKNVGLVSKLELFENYASLGNMDVNWQNTIAMKVNNFITVNFITQLIYDNDIDILETDETGAENNLGPKVQFKSVLGVGLSYNFGATKE